MIYAVLIYHIYSIYINTVEMKGYSVFFEVQWASRKDIVIFTCHHCQSLAAYFSSLC